MTATPTPDHLDVLHGRIDDLGEQLAALVKIAATDQRVAALEDRIDQLAARLAQLDRQLRP